MEQRQDKDIYRMVSNWDANKFSLALRTARQSKGYTRKRLGELIGKDKQQIRRYEEFKKKDKQMPTLDTLVKICMVLQVDANYLLSLEWINCKDYPEDGVIYLYNKDFDNNRVLWTCPEPDCRNLNITYDTFDKRKLKKGLTFTCDHCYSNFGELYED